MIIILDKVLKNYYGFTSFTKEIQKDRVVVEQNKKIFFLYSLKSVEKIPLYYQLYTLVDYCDDFVWNRFGDIVTTIHNSHYILCYSNKAKEKRLPLFSFYSAKVKGKLNWRELWIKKSDYLESYISNNRGKYPLIEESMPYYLGLLETGIYLLKEETENIDLYVQHNKMDPEEYNNPLNLIIDGKERDFSEYLKYLFISKKYKEVDISNLLKQGKDFFNYNLVIARLFLVNNYFQEVDEIILNQKEDKDLKEILKRTEEYEEYILEILEAIKKIKPLKKYPILR